MTNQEMFNQKLKELGYDDMPEGILLIGEKKEELLEFINNNSKGGYSISADGKIDNEKFGQETQLDAILKKLQEEQKNIIMLVENLSNIEKDSPVVAYIDDSEKSRILAIDSTYFDENKLIIREYDGEKIEVKENPALVDYIIKKMLKSNKPQIVPMGRDEINATSTMYTNVYAGPSDSTYASIGSINMGEGVVVVGESLGWFHIRYFITNSNQEKTGYVPKSYIFYTGSTGEEDFYGEFCYAKAKTEIRSTQNFSETVPGFGTIGQYEGMTLLYSYEYFGKVISFVEYSTSNGTKRGYMYESEIVKPLSNKSCVVRATARKVTYSGPDSSVYSDLGAIGVNELAAVLAKEGDWLYIEYNTNSNRKRGYITTSNIVYYHRPGLFPDFYRTTNAGQKDNNAWVTARENVYAGPNTTYANIGAVNSEHIINYKTNSGSNEPLTYIEYWITGTSTMKAGYISTNNIITQDPGQQPAEKHLTTITQTYKNFSTREVYGKTQLQRDMYYYKAGSGAKHLFLIFAHHGWEDGLKADGTYFAGDGDALIRIAQNFIERFEATDSSTISDILSKWTIYVFPGINLDGIADGVGVGYGQTNLGDNGSFGRCFYNGLDPNRNWAGNFKVDSSVRNKTGSIPFQAIELKNLRDCLRSNRSTSGKNVLLDIHGWYNTTYGDYSVAKYYISGMNLGNNTGTYGSGYLMNWANNPTTESTDENASNQAGIGADAVSLVELKPTIDYSINKIENDYGLQFYNSTMNLLKEYN